AAAVNAALLKHLPRQQPPDELFNQLSALSNNAAVRQAQPLLMSLISLLLGRTLAKPTEPNPKGVRQQLLNGGSLLESKLAHADRTNLAQDQKALLLKLAQQLPQGGARELPSGDSERLQQLVQQAISRVISNQIHSLGSQASQDREGEATRMLVTDIPVQGQTGRHETVHVHIKEQHSSATETEQAPPRWQVELSFKIAGLPPMSATLTLEQQQISLVWQGESGTRHLLQPRLGQLQQRLEGLGLEVAVLGVRDRSERRPGTQPGTALIDVET
ncbi:MAG TPA: flagellar hook-length control protein FliK, partial [Motiliproteus sp.]